MSLRIIQSEEAISKLRDEQNYTGAYLECDEDIPTKARAPEVEPWLERIHHAEVGQQLCWRNEIRARAAVNSCQVRARRLIKRFSLMLLAVFEDRKSLGFTRYFPKESPSKISRGALVSIVDEIKQWPAFLNDESNPQLKPFTALFQDILGSAAAALSLHDKAIEATKQQRYNQIFPLIEELNTWRQSLYGWLTQRSAEQGFETDWARSFFL